MSAAVAAKFHALPAVEFRAQAVVPRFPDELHEAIVMSPELQAWAIAHVADYKSMWDAARGVESSALSRARGEYSWRRIGGHRIARNADHAGKLYSLVEMMSRGRVADGWNGWATRHDWQQITEALEQYNA